MSWRGEHRNLDVICFGEGQRLCFCKGAGMESEIFSLFFRVLPKQHVLLLLNTSPFSYNWGTTGEWRKLLMGTAGGGGQSDRVYSRKCLRAATEPQPTQGYRQMEALCPSHYHLYHLITKDKLEGISGV